MPQLQQQQQQQLQQHAAPQMVKSLTNLFCNLLQIWLVGRRNNMATGALSSATFMYSCNSWLQACQANCFAAADNNSIEKCRGVQIGRLICVCPTVA